MPWLPSSSIVSVATLKRASNRLESGRTATKRTQSDTVSEADELALIPPVSGGATALPADENYENIFLAAAVMALLAANTLWIDVAVFAAVLVGVTAMWAVDIAANASNRDLVVDYRPAAHRDHPGGSDNLRFRCFRSWNRCGAIDCGCSRLGGAAS